VLEVVEEDVVLDDDDGAAVAVPVVAAVSVMVVVFAAGAVVDAVVDSVVELVDDVVVEPQAAMAISAPAAAKLRIKRMLSSSVMGKRRHRRSTCQTPWRNLTNLKATPRRPVVRPTCAGTCRFRR
jgi:hypothetical protein